MEKTNLRFGCQTFTWEMLGAGWTGGPDDLITAISNAGYSGIEITDTMIGAYADRPSDFSRKLSDAGLKLVSFAFGSDSGFTEPNLVASDLETGRRWIEFAAHFPDALVSMGSATIMAPGARDQKFATAAEVYNKTTELGLAAGVAVAIHPSSHHNTLLLDYADYDQIFELLDPNVGWIPDTGHILRGDHNIDATLATYRDRIRYVHLKDVDATGDWAILGAGICDIKKVIETASTAPNFNGWIVVEEESNEASADPSAAVARNYATLRQMDMTTTQP